MADERDIFESTAGRRFQRRGSRLKEKWNEEFSAEKECVSLSLEAERVEEIEKLT